MNRVEIKKTGNISEVASPLTGFAGTLQYADRGHMAPFTVPQIGLVWHSLNQGHPTCGQLSIFHLA